MKCWANKTTVRRIGKTKNNNKSSLALFGLGHLMVKVFQLVCNLFDLLWLSLVVGPGANSF